MTIQTVLYWVGIVGAFVGSVSLASVIGSILGERVSDEDDMSEELAGTLTLLVISVWAFVLAVQL